MIFFATGGAIFRTPMKICFNQNRCGMAEAVDQDVLVTHTAKETKESKARGKNWSSQELIVRAFIRLCVFVGI